MREGKLRANCRYLLPFNSPKILGENPLIFNIDRMSFFIYIVSQPFKVKLMQLHLEKRAVFNKGEKSG